MLFLNHLLAAAEPSSQDLLVWAAPGWFWALAWVPMLYALFVYASSRDKNVVAAFVNERLAPRLVTSLSPGRQNLRLALLLLAYSLMVFALARPQLGYTEHKTVALAGDIVFLFDTSRSMLADDVVPNRFEQARLFALDLLQLMPEDWVGIVAVAGRSYVMAPLTSDHQALEEVLGSLDTTVVPRGGTSFAAGLQECQRLLSLRPRSAKAVVFLTDGEDLEAGAVDAAQELAKQNVVVHAVAFGTAAGSLIPITNEAGGSDYVRDSAGKIVRSRMDLAQLLAIATATGGMIVQPSQDKSALQRLMNGGLSKVAKTMQRDRTQRVPIERFQIPLGAAITLLIICYGLPSSPLLRRD